jgi:hypothetical protein
MDLRLLKIWKKLGGGYNFLLQINERKLIKVIMCEKKNTKDQSIIKITDL